MKIIVSLFLVMGCAAPADRAGTPLEGYAHSVAMAGCAPWDGPATSIFLTPEPVTLSTIPGQEVPGPHIWVSVYQAREDLRGRRVEIDQRDSATAGRCDEEDGCESAYRGWVRVEEASEDAGVRGEVHLEFATGDPIAGTFEADWHQTMRICG